MFKIITEYSYWFIPLCLLLGAAYAYVFYRTGRNNDFPHWVKRLLMLLRFVTVSLIAFLLLSPLVKTTFRQVEKPIIIIAQDNSQSIVTNKDSVFYRKNYLNELDKLKAKLDKNIEIVTYYFGEKLTKEPVKFFKDRQTNISDALNEINNVFANRNVGALVLATDGIYNNGINPQYASEKIRFPIYTVAMGDTIAQKDIILQKINYNKTAFVGNSFPVEIIMQANKTKGARTNLTIKNNSQTVFSKDISINSETYNEVVLNHLMADKPGLLHYTINLSTVKDEISVENNTKEIFINVLSTKEKILILANSPHPDVAALKQAIETNYNYDVETYILADFNKNFQDYNVVIFHQLPSITESANAILTKISKAEIPALFVAGSQSDLNALNSMVYTGVLIADNRNMMNESQAVINNSFPSFTISKELSALVNSFPPLNSPFGNYRVNNAATVLFYQRIGSVVTTKPLIMFNRLNNTRYCVVAGEGLWRWRLIDFMIKGNHTEFNELINKIVQYLSVKSDKSRFHINHPNNYLETETISIDAELYNDNYELINTPEANITIENAEAKKYPFTFSRTNNAYHLDAGSLPAGIYRYSASVKLGNEIYKKDGEFSVTAINIETVNTLANHTMLYNISKNHKAEMYYPGQLDKLAEAINKRDDIKPMSYQQKRFNDVINLFWLLLLIIGLLSAEWFIRKRSGSY